MIDEIELIDLDGDGVPDVVEINIRWAARAIWGLVLSALGALSLLF
jgi:hypothetical protein